MDGIRRQLAVPQASDENLFPTATSAAGEEPHLLPLSLGEALDELEKDQVIRTALGPQIYETFILAKRLEWDDYRLEVTPWELEKYLSAY